MEWLVAGYYALAALAVGVAALLTIQTWEHRRYARSRARHRVGGKSKGLIALLVPCKGADADLESNLRPLFEQDYEPYELVFAVEGLDDPACRAIQRLMAQYPGLPAQLVTAGTTTISGQKVHNLRAASEHLHRDVKILAFIDSDVRPPRDWLRLLTLRLDHHGAATGYRWFVPKRITLANCLLASMDSAVASIMFPGMHHTVWGGSWAIRRDVFEMVELREAWQGTLSDDLVAARVLGEITEPVAFESACILPSPLDVDFPTVAAFVRRQFAIGRFYSPVLWTVSLCWHLISQFVFWTSGGAAVWGAYQGAAWTWQPASVLLVLYALHVFRGWVRQRASRYYLPSYQRELLVARWFDICLGPLGALALCLGLISSAFGRQIVWKNIRYELERGGRIRSITFGQDSPRHAVITEPDRGSLSKAA